MRLICLLLVTALVFGQTVAFPGPGMFATAPPTEFITITSAGTPCNDVTGRFGFKVTMTATVALTYVGRWCGVNDIRSRTKDG